MNDRSSLGRAWDVWCAWLHDAEDRHGEWVPVLAVFLVAMIGACMFIGIIAGVLMLIGVGSQPPLLCPEGSSLETYVEHHTKSTRQIYRCGETLR